MEGLLKVDKHGRRNHNRVVKTADSLGDKMNEYAWKCLRLKMVLGIITFYINLGILIAFYKMNWETAFWIWLILMILDVIIANCTSYRLKKMLFG